ncbi:MAG: hypothetical protein HC817_01755 [Saprospiraceae bacterium]|nr:hypothetical protein [Saprospiraceae bacterium]
MPANEIMGFDYVRVNLAAYATDDNFYDLWHKAVAVVTLKRDDKNQKYVQLRLENKLGKTEKILGGHTRTWGDLYLYVKIPKNIQAKDRIEVVVWNNNFAPIIIDDFKISACQF